MDWHILLEEIRRRAGFPSTAEAEAALYATVETLGERLRPLDAAVVASLLPVRLSDALRRRERPGAFGLDELFQRVGARVELPFGEAREAVLVVCQTLARTMPEDILIPFRERLPDEMATLLISLDSLPEAVGRRVEARPGTLASGRPGSQHPLSEAAPGPHSNSVARADNPHEESKLSSTRGISTERDGRTLATGKPGPSRPLSEND